MSDCQHGITVVLNTGIGKSVRCSRCERVWASADDYFRETWTPADVLYLHNLGRGLETPEPISTLGWIGAGGLFGLMLLGIGFGIIELVRMGIYLAHIVRF